MAEQAESPISTEITDGEVLMGEECAEVAYSPVQIQQQYFENVGDVDWIRYDKNTMPFMLANIAFALFGPPTSEKDVDKNVTPDIQVSSEKSENISEKKENTSDKNENFSEKRENTSETNEKNSEKRKNTSDENISTFLQGYTSEQRENAMQVFNKIKEQTKYSANDEEILMKVLLVICAKPLPLKFYQLQPRDYWHDLHIRNDIILWNTPVFKIRKCIPTQVQSKYCCIYIDSSARVYHSWDSYLKNNTQPKCVLITPVDGKYEGELLEEEEFAVKLTVCPSPALGLKAKVLHTTDTTSTVASIGSIGVVVVAAFTPVAPVVISGALITGIATGVYTVVRSSFHLRDRSQHEQTLSLRDPEARGSWLNIGISTVGVGTGVASKLLYQTAAAGANLSKMGQLLANTVDGLRYANLIAGGGGILNSIVNMFTKYKDHGKLPTTLEIVQLTSAVLFFSNAYMTRNTAASIIEDAQVNTINDYRTTLRSNRHRKVFDKVSAESRRVHGQVEGNTEVIRGIKNIANKDEFFASVLRTNKELNQHKIRISMTEDGQVNLNAQHKFDPTDLYKLGKEGRSELFNSMEPTSLATKNVPTRLNAGNSVISNHEENSESQNLIVGIHVGEFIRIGQSVISITLSGAKQIDALLENLSEKVYNALVDISVQIISILTQMDLMKMSLVFPDEDKIYMVVKFVFNYIKKKVPFGEPCWETDNGIVIVLKEFFQNGKVKKETIRRLRLDLLNWLEGLLFDRHLRFPNKRERICTECNGVNFYNVK